MVIFHDKTHCLSWYVMTCHDMLWQIMINSVFCHEKSPYFYENPCPLPWKCRNVYGHSWTFITSFTWEKQKYVNVSLSLIKHEWCSKKDPCRTIVKNSTFYTTALATFQVAHNLREKEPKSVHWWCNIPGNTDILQKKQLFE